MSRIARGLSLGYGLLRLSPEAYHRARNLLRRAGRTLVRELSARWRAALGEVARADNTALYPSWRAINEPDDAQLRAQRRTAERWLDRPLISVVSPVFAPPAEALADGIASVQAQTYDRWELVLVLAGPQPESVLEVVRAAGRDPRVRTVALETNLGIAANTNAGLARASGAYVAFLDHDDLLSPDALFEVARRIREEPEVDLVTFDEDKVAADGRTRLDPIFKPSVTSPEHLLSYNDRMHCVVRRARLEELGGITTGVDGAQDWDLGLRLLERGARARHVPRVLYHWRKVPGSAAADAMAKGWAFEPQRVVLRAHLERAGLRGVAVDHERVGVVRARWNTSGRRASIIIPTKDRAALLATCIRSIRERTTYPSYEIVVIDTGSREPETQRLYETLAGDGIRILHDDAPFNFSRVNNRGARESNGDILVFMNNDVEVLSPGWLDELMRWAERPEIGCVGPKLVYPNGSLQHAGIVMGLGGHGSHVYQGGAAHHEWGVFGSVDFYRNYLALGGACLAVRRDLFDVLGGFDEAYSLCYSDIDLCLKASEAGHRNVYTPFAELVHHEGATRGLYFPPADVLRASVRMYPLVIQGDPFYSHNLSFQEKLPTVAAEDDPAARAALIAHIATLFGVHTGLQTALHDELRGRTAEWRGYERLVRSTHPALPVGTVAAGRLRLLFITHDLSRSGAPMVLLHLARALARLGHEVSVLAPKGGRLREDLEEAGARVIVSPLALEAPYALGDWLGAFDAILPNTVLAWRAGLAASGLGKPVVWLIHESGFGAEYLRRNPGAVQALAAADEVVLPSRSTLEIYREFNAGNLSSEIYGFDAPVVSKAVPALASGSFHFISLGSLEPRKGQDVLVAAFRGLPRDLRARAELHLLGRSLDPPFVDALRGAVRSSAVRLHGEVAPAEALAFLAASSALVCSSRDETGPLAVMEAMALGKAIISTRVGAVPELLEDGENGLLVQPGDVEAMSAALARLIREPDLAPRLGGAARLTFRDRLAGGRYGKAIASRVERALARRVGAAGQEGVEASGRR